MTEPHPTTAFLFSCPRSLSNLLIKLLSEQIGWDRLIYFLDDAFQYGLQNFDDGGVESAEERRGIYAQKLKAGYEKLMAVRERAAEKVYRRCLLLSLIQDSADITNRNLAKTTGVFLKSHIVQVLNPSLVFPSLKDDASIASLFPGSDSPRTNPTVFTDEMLLSFTPVFLIRHPALLVDSFYRAKSRANMSDFGDNYAPYSNSLCAIKCLFEWYEAADNETGDKMCYPIVIDADDLLEGDTVARLAQRLGMNPDKIPHSWAARSTEGLEAERKSFVEGLWNSTRIDTSKSSRGLDVAALERSWGDVYGSEVGSVLQHFTNKQMEHYLWLKSRRF